VTVLVNGQGATDQQELGQTTNVVGGVSWYFAFDLPDSWKDSTGMDRRIDEDGQRRRTENSWADR